MNLINEKEFKMNLLRLTVGGGVVFWAITIATSLLPIAAEYRAAYSNWSTQTVWVASLPMGMIIGCCVSYFLLRHFDRIPTKSPIPRSVTLSFIALIIAVVLIDVPQSFLHPRPGDALYYFLIGVAFNVARFFSLGIAIGYLYGRLYARTQRR
jgi:NhaP-type Na+/H+ or K+/H+ antiporter